MKKYSWILLDLDNTIFDFDASEKDALQAVVEGLGLEFDRRIFNSYHHVNKKCWKDFEAGKLPQSDIQVTRFTKFLERENIDADPTVIGNQYLEGLIHSPHFEDGAMDVLDHFHGHLNMAIITNGLKEVQRPRIRKNNITHFFKTIVVSDEIGVSKPHRAFFDHAFEQIGWPEKSEVLVIGDGLSSDIKGGHDYGVDTCWYNRRGIEVPKGYAPTYTVDTIGAVKAVRKK